MPKMKFTARTIQGLKPDPKRVVEYQEEGRKRGTGVFSIRVSKTAIKVWYLVYQGDCGKQKRHTLGEYPKLSLSEARHLSENNN